MLIRLLILLIINQVSLALDIQTLANVDSHQANDQGTWIRGLKINEDDVLPSQIENNAMLSEHETHEAQVWQLKEEEEKRYVNLMRNKSGVYYRDKAISPVWVLGLNARNDQERQHYAEMAAKQEQQKIGKELAWNAAFTQAYQKQTEGLPRVQPFDKKPFSPYQYQALKLNAHDRLTLYVMMDTDMSAAMTKLVDVLKQTPTATLSIHVIPTDASSNLSAWKKAHRIMTALTQVSVVMEHQHDLKKIHQLGLSLPLLVKQHKGKSQVIPWSQF